MIDVCVTKGYVPGFRRELNVRELGGYESADGRRWATSMKKSLSA